MKMCLYVIPALLAFSAYATTPGHPDETKAICAHNLEAPFPQEVSEWIGKSQTPGYYAQMRVAIAHRLDADVAAILRIPADGRTYANTILAADLALDRMSGPGVTLKTVAALVQIPKDSLAEVEAFETALDENMSRFSSNANLLRAIEQTPVAPGNESELRLALIRRLDDGGARLSGTDRSALHILAKRVADESSAYTAQIKENTTILPLAPPDCSGLSPEFRRTLGTDGRLGLPVTEPDIVRRFLSEAQDPVARKRVYLAYRGRDRANAQRLFNITAANSQIAQIFGKPNYFTYVVDNRSLSGGAAQVEDILTKLEATVKPQVRRQIDRLRQAKLKDGSTGPLDPWDLFYYDRMVNQVGSADDSAAIEAEAYFPADTFAQTYLDYVHATFALDFEPIHDVPVWHESVQIYLVRRTRTQEPLGYLILDLFKRPGKNPSTAFVEELVARHQGRLPVTLLMTNWGKYEDRASFGLPPYEVSTMLHEGGHALHNLLQTGETFSTSGWTHPTDYMEVPSVSQDHQIKNPDVLIALSSLKNHPEQKMPRELAQRVAAGESGFQLLGGDLFSTSHMQNTIFLAKFDIEVQKQIGQMRGPEDINALYRRMYLDFFAIDPGPDDHFPQTFHHMAGEYAGNYSSYLWAGLVAAHVNQRLEELGGALNPEAIAYWVETMLSQPQHERPASVILQSFLGGPLDPTPMFRELGIAPGSPATAP